MPASLFDHHVLPSRCALSLILLCSVATAAKADAETQDRYRWIDFHFDKRPSVARSLSENLSFGAELKLSYGNSRNLNLNGAQKEREEKIELEGKLGLLYDANWAIRSYFELEFSAEGERTDGATTSDRKVQINEAYISLFGKNRNQALTFGRWSVSDDREWMFDEELDGIHFFSRNRSVAIELMYAREQLFRKDLFGRHDKNEPDHVYARAFSNLPGKNIGSIYGLYQKGQDADDADLLWLGASLIGKTRSDLDYWAEFAHVRGTDDDRNVRGYGLDLGMTKTFENVPYNPRFTAGFAFGSGDGGGSTDTAFRQTGIQGNSSKFGGRKKFKYYGEVFDPELSNLAVLTLGAGFDILGKSSIDIVYHGFLQHRVSKKIRDSKLDRKPNGSSRNLGQEIDVIVGIREFDGVDLDFIGGLYFPGSAFAEDRDPVVQLGFEITLEF